jgi:hypothetical protein
MVSALTLAGLKPLVAADFDREPHVLLYLP